jgi:hypothetical protein
VIGPKQKQEYEARDGGTGTQSSARLLLLQQGCQQQRCSRFDGLARRHLVVSSLLSSPVLIYLLCVI